MCNSEQLQGIKKCLSVIFVSILLSLSSGHDSVMADDYTGEKITFSISPLGRAEYNNLGEVEVDGQRLDCVTFKTQAMGFADTETIYSDPRTHLPVKVERDISEWMGKEHLVEQYDQVNHVLTIDKYKKGKKVKQYVFKKDGPIHNAILLPFDLRTVGDIDIGWEMTVRVPEEFKVRLESIEEIPTPAGRVMAYHFTSTPARFEIWASKDALRLPVKIRGMGDVNYMLTMRKHLLPPTGTPGVK